MLESTFVHYELHQTLFKLRRAFSPCKSETFTTAVVASRFSHFFCSSLLYRFFNAIGKIELCLTRLVKTLIIHGGEHRCRLRILFHNMRTDKTAWLKNLTHNFHESLIAGGPFSSFCYVQDAKRTEEHNVVCLVDFAMALMQTLDTINRESFQRFRLRMGLNHGPVIAGVIGNKLHFVAFQ